MENVLILRGKYRWRHSIEFHGNWYSNPQGIPWQPFPWNSMGNVLIIHGDIFHGEISWNSMGIDLPILQGIPRRFFTRVCSRYKGNLT